jgi:hypothetical protein
VVEGRWVGWLKRWVDRKVMERFGLGIPIIVGPPQAAVATTPGAEVPAP